MFDKLKQLSKDTAIYGISTMLGRFLNFLLVPFYTNVFTPSEYGIVTNIYAFLALFYIVYVYGMDAAYMKFASLKRVSEDKDTFSTSFYSILFTSIIFSLLFLVFRQPLQESFSIPDDYSSLIYYLIFILFFDALAVMPFVKLRLMRKGKVFALYKFLNIVLTVILNLFFILRLKWGIEAVFLSNVIASLFSLILVTPIILKGIHFSFNKQLLKALLKFGLPFLPAGLGAMLIQVIDRPILEYLTDLGTVGIYQANHKLGIFMMLFVTMFQFAWQPFFLEESKGENAKQIFSKVLTYFTLVGCIILVVLSLFISDFVTMEIFGRTIIGKAFLGGLYIVPVVLLGYLFNGMYIIFTAGIFIKDKSIYIPFITIFGALISISVNFISIPFCGIMGCALASLSAYFAMATGFYFVTQKFYHINYEISKLIKLFFSVAVTGTLYYILLFNNNLLFLYKVLLLFLFFIMVYILVIDKQEINFVKKRLLGIRS